MWYKNLKNKFHAKKTEYKGIKYASGREAKKAWDLDMLVRGEVILRWERQAKEELFGINKSKICSYYVDFKIFHVDGTIEYLEIKSKPTATPEWKLKWKLLEDKYKQEVLDKKIILTVEY